jgi:hypothetical protein
MNKLTILVFQCLLILNTFPNNKDLQKTSKTVLCKLPLPREMTITESEDGATDGPGYGEKQCSTQKLIGANS